jgi:hypothetical protein
VSRVVRRTEAALALAFLLTLPAVNTRIHASDEIENFAYLRSVWFDRDLSFDNEYRYFVDAGYTRRDDLAGFIDATSETGLRPNYAPVGSSILWSPFYLIADIGVRLARAFGATTPADGFARPYLAAITIGSAVYGALAIALSIAVARRLASHAVSAALVIFIGTPLVFYMYAMPGMSHATSAFAVALFIWTWLRVRERWTTGGVAALAASGALMAMAREQDAALVAIPAIDYVWTRVRASGWTVTEGFRHLAVAATVFLIGVLPQLAAYRLLNGRFGPARVIGDKMNWTAPYAAPVMFSPEHGWFVWTPLALLAIAGLAWLALSHRGAVPHVRWIGGLLLAAVAIEVYVTGSLRSWTLAGAFGQRRFTGISICLIAGLAVVFSRVTPPIARRVLIAATALMVWWNVGLAIRFGENTMNRQRLELRSDVYRTFVELPLRLPGVAYRYVFDRASFYKQRPSGSPR